MELALGGSLLTVDTQRASIVCDQCTAARVKCSRKVTCRRCQDRGLTCTRDRFKYTKAGLFPSKTCLKLTRKSSAPTTWDQMMAGCSLPWLERLPVAVCHPTSAPASKAHSGGGDLGDERQPHPPKTTYCREKGTSYPLYGRRDQLDIRFSGPHLLPHVQPVLPPLLGGGFPRQAPIASAAKGCCADRLGAHASV